MPQWTERIENHAVFGVLDAVRQQIAAITQDPPDGAEPAQSFERLKWVVDYTGLALSAVDPALVHPGPLNNVQQSLSQVQSELNSYSADRSAKRLESANSYVDNVLLQLAQVPKPHTDEQLDGLRDSLTSFRRATGQLLRNAQEDAARAQSEVDGLRSRVQELQADIATQKGRLDTAITQFQQQFSQAEDARRASHATDEKARATAFAEEQTERREEFDGQVETQSAAIKELIGQWDSAMKEVRSSAELDTKNLLLRMEEHRKYAERLVGIITDTGMAGGFQRVANEELAAAKSWRKLAVGAMVGLIAFAVLSFLYTFQGTFEWPMFAGRVFVTLTFGVLAAYAAKQADEHLQNERHNRRLELEIASIDPYLAPLPEETRFDVKRALAERMFGRDQRVVSDTRQVVTSGTLMDALRLTLDNLTKR